MPDIQDMIGREVELIANGIEYRGTLIEVSDEAVFLKMTTQWMELPAASVSDIRLAAQYRNVQESEGIDEAAEEFG